MGISDLYLEEMVEFVLCMLPVSVVKPYEFRFTSFTKSISRIRTGVVFLTAVETI